MATEVGFGGVHRVRVTIGNGHLLSVGQGRFGKASRYAASDRTQLRGAAPGLTAAAVQGETILAGIKLREPPAWLHGTTTISRATTTRTARH